DFMPGHVPGGVLRSGRSSVLLMHSAAAGGAVCLEGRALGDAVQPGSQGLVVADGVGLLRQGEEGGLEGILGVLLVVQDVAANTGDQRAMPVDQGGKGGPVVAGGESVQQLVVIQLRAGLADDEPAEATDGIAQGCRCHAGALRNAGLFSLVPARW